MVDQSLHPSPPPIMTPTLERRVLCSHTTMERDFGSQERLVRCQLCGEADLGWIYVCTEDKVLLASGAARKTTSADTAEEPTPKLSDWILSAIENGQYTEEQIKILKSQRSNVRDAIANNNRPQLPKQDDDPVVTAAAAGDEALDALISEQQRADLLTAQLKRVLGLLRADDEATGSLVANCHLRLCHYCFPSGKDRAWLSLDKVCCSEPESVETSPSDIFEIPRAELPLFPLRRAECECDIPATQADNYPSTGSTVDSTNNSNTEVASGAMECVPQLEHWPNATMSDAPPTDLSTRELLQSAFSNYKRQRLGTPRKVHRRRPHLSLDNADECIAPGRQRPKLTRRPRWTRDILVALDEESDPTACVENEVIASEGTDGVTPV